jgi:hypothetical protein
MTKFFAHVLTVTVLVFVAISLWHAATAQAAEPSKRRCDIYETKEGVQIISCSTRTAEQARRCKVVSFGGEYSVVCPAQ